MNYETNDLYLAGFLIAKGLSLSSSESNNGTMVFRFRDTTELQNHVNTYYSLNAQVNPQHFGSALKMLKNLLYQNKQMYNNNGKSITTNTYR